MALKLSTLVLYVTAAVLMLAPVGGCSIGPQASGGITTWEIEPPAKEGGWPKVTVRDGKEGTVSFKFRKDKDGVVSVEYTGKRSAAAMIQARVAAEDALGGHIAKEALPAVMDTLMRALAPVIGP